MHAHLRLTIGVALVAAALTAGASLANERIASTTKTTCTSCHDKPGSKRLTDTGKYYETVKTLDGYAALNASFGRCTTCHDTKPGSQKLTRRGTQFAAFAKDMPALNQWMREGHPIPAKQ